MKDWEKLGVEGHFIHRTHGSYHEFLTESYAKIVGSKSSEVIAMNTLTVNLHLMMVSFYRPNKKRNKILIEGDISVRYLAIESQIKHHGYSPLDTLIKLTPRPGESIIRTEDIQEIIQKEGDQISLILIGGVNYYTGQIFDFKTITKTFHQKNIIVGFDLLISSEI